MDVKGRGCEGEGGEEGGRRCLKECNRAGSHAILLSCSPSQPLLLVYADSVTISTHVGTYTSCNHPLTKSTHPELSPTVLMNISLVTGQEVIVS